MNVRRVEGLIAVHQYFMEDFEKGSFAGWLTISCCWSDTQTTLS
jgi:hypothetical protein